MQEMNLEEKMKDLHKEVIAHEPIEGSILLKDNGLHISSTFKLESFEKRRLSAEIAHVFRYFNKIGGVQDLTFKMNGVHLHLKHLPSRKLIFTTVTKPADFPKLDMLMSLYSKEFQAIF